MRIDDVNMADVDSRKEKVAAGLKKLRQFQQRANRSSSVERRENNLTAPIKENSRRTQKVIEAKEKVLDQKEGSSCWANHNSTESLSNDCLSPALDSSRQNNTNELHNTKRSKSDPNIDEVSSSESLRQITQQINGLMSQTHAFLNGDVEDNSIPSTGNSELERRNQELAVLLDNNRQTNEQLQFQLQELKARITRIQRDFEKERKELQEKSHKEQVALKDQLQVHIQTIGILVAEKTELQSSAAQSQQTAKQKAAEVEELQGRLRGSRQRVSDLERELGNISNSSQLLEKNNKEYSKEVDRLKMEVYKLGKSNEEQKLQIAELSEKFNKKLHECQNLEQELAESKSKLSISELYVQQLSNSITPEGTKQLEDLHQEKLELEKKLMESKDTVQKLTAERDQMSEQYQLYVQQLSQQVTSLKDEMKELMAEREKQLLENSALQSKIESLQQKENSNNQIAIKSEEYEERMSEIESKLKQVTEDYNSQVNDNAQMSKLVEEQQVRIEELESIQRRLQEQHVDKEKLLETMQSDKIAASRAVSQNCELKKQLEELQKGFVKMSNDKLTLCENLDREHHITKELGERLSQQEEELQELRDQLFEKEQQLRKSEEKSTKEIYQQDQITDRMRHYEAQGHLTEILQQELAQAQERVHTLVNQNTDLRMNLARQAEIAVSTDKPDERDSKRSDLVASLSASVRQLEMERDQLLHQLEEQQTRKSNLKAQMREMKDNQINLGIDNEDISMEEYQYMKGAMKQLEERFKRTMDQIAELSDQKQQLEHLVTQLQGETDTIGDYIALYQVQRGIMRKRAAEKDEYIALLAKDREELKSKLGELQNLMMRLLEERKQLQNYGTSVLVGSNHLPGKVIPVSSEENGNLLNGEEQKSDKRTLNQTENLPAPSTDPVASLEKRKKGDESTAKKIMDLLTEIGTSNLVEKSVPDDFHPCPLCSGRLITV